MLHALASAFDPNCGPATTIYGLSLTDIIGGLVLVIIGIVLRSARHQARPGTAKPAVAPSQAHQAAEGGLYRGGFPLEDHLGGPWQ